MSTMQEYAAGSTLFGGNVPYIEEQYERYLANPDDVSGEWRAYFDSLRGGASDEEIAAAINAVWRQRDDRYSEIRTAETVKLHKVEMSYIGG